MKIWLLTLHRIVIISMFVEKYTLITATTFSHWSTLKHIALHILSYHGKPVGENHF